MTLEHYVLWKHQCEEGFWRPLLLGGEHPNISSCDTMHATCSTMNCDTPYAKIISESPK